MSMRIQKLARGDRFSDQILSRYFASLACCFWIGKILIIYVCVNITYYVFLALVITGLVYLIRRFVMCNYTRVTALSLLALLLVATKRPHPEAKIIG